MCTIADDCALVAESGLKPPFESPQLDFPQNGMIAQHRLSAERSFKKKKKREI